MVVMIINHVDAPVGSLFYEMITINGIGNNNIMIKR